MRKLLAFISVALALLLGSAHAAPPLAVPPNVSPDPSLPMTLLSLSKDFSMFSRAYTDYEDLDFDGKIDYTFMPDFTYYGYFDSTKCYTYNSGSSGRFVPDSLASVTTATVNGVERKTYYCAAAGASSSSLWSGNFLNWATMSRMDVLRKILFGGLRSTDTASATTLEMSFVPRNSQAFVKFYNGNDLIRLTPFNYSNGITLCRRHENVTSGASAADKASHTTTKLPQIRVAKGNILLWNMSEVRTCNWSDEIAYSWKAPTVNYITANYVGVGGTDTHVTSVPAKADGAKYSTLGPEFTARVEACNPALLGAERCKQYGNNNPKPVGLLHEFGESANFGVSPARAEFGLLMGSFDNNLNRGILRKNMAEINDEINPSTGQFSGTGIISSINELSLYGYDLDGGSYSQTCYSNSITNGNCPSWGNPVSEILLEGLRYFAGKTAGATAGSIDNAFGFPKPAWTDPMTVNRTYASTKTRVDLYGKNVCRPLNMVTVSSGVSTFDDDGMSTFSTDLGAPQNAAYYTNLIGTKELIANTTRLIGSNGVNNDGQCSGKLVGNLSDVKGLCPDAPNMRGTYLGAGAAFYANTNRIRNNLTVPADANVNALKVKQYAISMSGGAAQIRVKIPNSNPTRTLIITPASIDSLVNPALPGNMVDFKVLKSAADGTSGTFLVLWQHAALGEDQDQDMLGTIRYQVTAPSGQSPTIKIYTQTLEADTGSTQPFGFGYTIVGSNKDGVHFHSGINNYVFTTTVALSVTFGGSIASGSCDKLCARINNQYVKTETVATFTMVGSTDAVIQDPLWYIAKYGGFKDDKVGGSGFPDATTKWDVKRADGTCTSGSCSDGIPDNYFLARRPDLLEESLRQVFLDIVETSNSAPAVSRPDLRAGDFKYVAQFDANDLRGELVSYQIKPNGDFDSVATALGHKKLTDTPPASRQIITNVGVNGVAFTSAAITAATGGAAYIASVGAQTVSTVTTTSTRADARIEYLRGNRSNERPFGYDFRARSSNSIMGGIVNSNPWLQDRPVANFFGSNYAGYGAFKAAQSNRNRLLWVGANDGMLHGFKAETLDPVISYVPGVLAPQLSKVMDPAVTAINAFMDGSPFTGDLSVGSGTGTWKTYLFSSLGRGGQAIYALDVTNAGTTATAAMSQTDAASVFKWQFTLANDADLGYVISEGGTHPVTGQASQIAKFPNGKFGAIFGNGVNSNTGKAVLYILFADGPNSSGTWTTGTHYIKIVADAGTGNGLSQPFWMDTDEDGIADTIYAGDLKGNMWKFDVSSATTTNWKVAYNLYAAKDGSTALPITAAPVVQFHPMGGMMVAFTTGKSVDTGDFPKTGVQQRIYGIWDKTSYAGATSTIPTGLTELLSRTLVINASNDLIQTRTTSIDWTTKKGWYINIPFASGMGVSNLEYAKDGSRDIGVPLIYPADSGTSCNGGSLGIYVQISGLTGLLNADVFGTGISTGDGVTVGVVLPDQRFRLAEDSTARCAAGLSCQRIIGADVSSPGSASDRTTRRNTTNSRIFWREIPGLRTTD